jgi:hypothetical protein
MRYATTLRTCTLLAAALGVPFGTPRAAAQGSSENANAGYPLPPLLGTPALATLYRPADVRVVVSVDERRLWVISRGDTVRSAVVSVAEGQDFSYAGHRWRFATPRGALRVLGKRTDPVWRPPDWHYAEVARMYDLKLRRLESGTRLRSGARLVVRDSIVGVLKPGDTTFYALPTDEHIVFDSTLFIPPANTHNRHLTGALGKYALDLGNGYLLHGTPLQSSVGRETTHGCIRLQDDDLEWMYAHIPVGARVYVH